MSFPALPVALHKFRPGVPRLSPSPGSEPCVASGEAVSSAPAAPGSGAARDQRPPLSSYLPCLRPFRSSVQIDGSLIRRSISVAARARISGGVRPGRSRRAAGAGYVGHDGSDGGVFAGRGGPLKVAPMG